MLPKYKLGRGRASVASTAATNVTMPCDFLDLLLKVGGAADFQEQIRKIAVEKIDRQEVQREHRRQLEEGKEKSWGGDAELGTSKLSITALACCSWKSTPGTASVPTSADSLGAVTVSTSSLFPKNMQ